MSSLSRKIRGRVTVSYGGPYDSVTAMIKSNISPFSAYNRTGQFLLTDNEADGVKYFNTYNNLLDGSFAPQKEDSRVAWNPPNLISKADGSFDGYPLILTITTSNTLLADLQLVGDAALNNFPVDVTTRVYRNEESTYTQFNVQGNTQLKVSIIPKMISGVTKIEIMVTRVNLGYNPIAISNILMADEVTYEDDKLFYVDLLEELSYNDQFISLGGVSANQLDVSFRNDQNSFFSGDSLSDISIHLKKNRKVQSWLGEEVAGQITWKPLGVYWTTLWDVPFNKLHVTTTAFDTIGFLSTIPFHNHNVIKNYTLYDLFEYVLIQATDVLPFVKYRIDNNLSQVDIPVAWFTRDSFGAALRSLAESYYVNVYCNREGVICVDSYNYNTSSAEYLLSTDLNITDISYPTRYSEVPNSVVISVYDILYNEGTEVLNFSSVKTIAADEKVIYLYNGIVDGNTTLSITPNIAHSVEYYSWGCEITYLDPAVIENVTAIGTTVSLEVNNSITMEDEASIISNGLYQIEIDSSFIQTTELATEIATIALRDASTDILNAEVSYRGIPELSLNDNVQLQGGLITEVEYSVARHTLSYNGGLTGTLLLNSR